MATADEILEAMEAETEEQILLIDNDLRTIAIPDSIKNIGVESDEDVKRLHFRMPKITGEIDLSEFELKINYMNAAGEGDVYPVTDKASNGDAIEFSWMIGRFAAKRRGDVKFIVCAKLKREGKTVKVFNTKPARLPVLEGLETEETIEQQNPDIIENILLRLDTLEESDGSYPLPIATADTLGGVKPVTKTDEMTQAVGVDAEGGLWALPGGAGGTWELAVNQEIAEDCYEAAFSVTDSGDSFTKYKELIILFHLKGNQGDGADVAAYTTGIHFGFANKMSGWGSKFDTRITGYAADESIHKFMIYHIQKTPYGILNLGTYSQYNTYSMSQTYSLVGASGVHCDSQLPISANSDPTLDMTTFSYDTEFERFVIGGYQKVIGAGSIVKIWGCT